MLSIQDALAVLQQHPSLTDIGLPMEVEGGIEIAATVPVSLPTRLQSAGISPTGIRNLEPCWLVFPTGWPMQAPKVWLRPDFPLDLPHINPHRMGERVNPCLFEGSMDEVLHRFGLERIIDQLCDWLCKAASGQLLDLEQGWEPTRRDATPSTVVFSAEDAIAKAPLNGDLLVTQGSYFLFEGNLLAYAEEKLNAVEPAFDQQHHEIGSHQFEGGVIPFFFARCVDGSDVPRVVSNYSPETVSDFASLMEQATSLGAKREQIERSLSSFAFKMEISPQRPNWSAGVHAIVVLLVQRPSSLIGSPGRSVEVLPYVVKFSPNPQLPVKPLAEAHPALHSHRVSPALLSLASGLQVPSKPPKFLIFGCGSLGSKVALHLGRAGFGNMTFVDNESLSPHNAARHALVPPRSPIFLPQKAVQMGLAFQQLGHDDCASSQMDAAELLLNEEAANQLLGLGDEASIVLDTTASLRVSVAATASKALSSGLHRRFVQSAMYSQGKAVYLFSEGVGRSVSTDDLRARLFELCRSDVELRTRLAGDSVDPTRIFVGDNCRSMTMPMTDSKVSRAASLVSSQLEQWVTHGLPSLGQLCYGQEDVSGIGMIWKREELYPSITFHSTRGEGWTVRVLSSIERAIDSEARSWKNFETGGALLGHVIRSTRTIIVAGMIDAPSDSVRSEATFILGTDGLVKSLRDANEGSLGHLHFIGTWHSHPKGGAASQLDLVTLRKIAGDAQGLPAVSLIWRPQDLAVEVNHL